MGRLDAAPDVRQARQVPYLTVERLAVNITRMANSDSSGYAIADLARLGGVTPRTVRYYVAQGLLPSPGSLGPATRYGEAHLARLRLIRRLQGRHLPLAEIRIRLIALSDAEVRSALATADQPPPRQDLPGSALDYVRGVLDTRDRLRPPPGYHLAARDGLAEQVRPLARVSGLEIDQRLPAWHSRLPAEPTQSRPAIPDRSQWERISLAPDVELHLRRPLSRPVNKRVERLVAIARGILEEDRP